MNSDPRNDDGADRASRGTVPPRLPGRVAVSGANGFIARRFMARYRERFDGVAALVRGLPRRPLPGVDYRICDVTEPHALRFAARDCDGFVHFAYDFRNRQTALAAARNVLELCRSARIARLVHLSTIAVYDQTRDGVLDERTPAAPWRDPYIESKILIERLLAAGWRDGYRQTVILQPGVVYGARGGWSDIALRGCRSERVLLPLAGEGRCSCVHVDDVCQAVFRALTAALDPGRTAPPRYVINGPDDASWAAFFAAHASALRELGVPPQRIHLRIEAPPTARRFADDAKKDLAMAIAFHPIAARMLYAALQLRPPKRRRPSAHDGLETLLDGDAPPYDAQRFDGMGRLYLATRYRADSALAARELGYAPEVDLAAGIERLTATLRDRLPRAGSARPAGAIVDLAAGDAAPATLRRRLCVIGTGIGGGALATTLLERGADLVIVEAGGREASDSVGLEAAGHPFGLAIYRDISLGGTGNAWRGLCSPRDPIDFERRDWVPESGWPIGIGDLTPHYRAAAARLGLDDYGFFADQSTIEGAGERARDIRFDRDRFELKYFLQTRPPKSFRGDLLAACEQRGGPLLLLNAPALELVADPSGRRIEKLVVKDPTGGDHHVEADVFVVCAGALETPRLLLNSRQGGRDGIGNEHGLVGAYLMDHPMVGMGQVKLRRARTAPLFQALAPAPHRIIKAGLIMREAAQRELRVPNHSVFLLPSLSRGFDDAYESARRTLITARRKRLDLHDVLTVATNPNVIQWALSYVTRWPALFRYADLFFIAEQTPTAASRVGLSEQRDRYGYRQARAEWRISDDDVASIERFNDLLLAAFPADGYETSYRRDHDDVAPALISAAHFCGTARMGADPRASVVDADLKVWGIDNLYVCDGSVMPTSGNANPSLTIAALADRLAAKLVW